MGVCATTQSTRGGGGTDVRGGARITQLGGEPDFNPEGWRRVVTPNMPDILIDMIREDLAAERVTIDSYSEMILYVADTDSTTRRMLEGILA